MTDDDPRTGPEHSATTTIASASTSLDAVVDVPANRLFKLTSVTVAYSDGGTANASVELYDEADGTTAGNESDLRDRFYITPGDAETSEGGYRAVEENLFVLPDGSQDGVYTVTVRGRWLTDLRDVQ